MIKTNHVIIILHFLQYCDFHPFCQFQYEKIMNCNSLARTERVLCTGKYQTASLVITPGLWSKASSSDAQYEQMNGRKSTKKGGTLPNLSHLDT